MPAIRGQTLIGILPDLLRHRPAALQVDKDLKGCFALFGPHRC